MTARRIAALVLSIAAFGVMACGSDDGSSEGAEYDRAWIAAMIEHHEGAIAMSELAEGRAESRFVKEFAANTIRSQTAEIALMREIDARLAADGAAVGKFGTDSGAGHTEADLAELENADDFDTRFMSQMVVHHDGALAMVDQLKSQGNDPALAALAARIATAQKNEIRQMEKELAIEPHEAVPGDDHEH